MFFRDLVPLHEVTVFDSLVAVGLLILVVFMIIEDI